MLTMSGRFACAFAARLNPTVGRFLISEQITFDLKKANTMSSVTADAIIAKLEELAEVRAAAEVTRLDYEAKRAEILKAIQAELEALAAEYEPVLASAHERVANLEAEVKSDVMTYGGSVKGSQMHAVYTRGRISWDNKGLDGYAVGHPEILTFRKEGEPSISLRAVK